MGSGDEAWEVVEGPEEVDPCRLAYDQIEINPMRACCVEVREKKLLFCLQAREALHAEARLCASNLAERCNTCKHRMPRFAQFIGDAGKFVAFNQDVDEPNVQKLREMRNKQRKALNSPADFNVVVIDEDFVKEYPVSVGPFDHVHFVCEEISDAGLSRRLTDLKLYLNGSFENRFQRLVDDPASLKLIQDTIPRLVRPDHWRNVVEWAVNFVAEARGKLWEHLPVHEKFRVMAFALLTGRASGNIHVDMQQASNLVDFMTEADSSEALVAMMDDRSNPETYQISRVAEVLRNKQVKSMCTVTLIWGVDGSPHKSDLDLHTCVNGKELFYGNKRVEKCCLDFDANASAVEKNPAENVSLNQVGTFPIRVNNFLNRDQVDVPFKVIVRKSGQECEVHEAVWPRTRPNGTLMEICRVAVTAEDLMEKPIELSEAEQRKLAAKELEWANLFGEPTCALACEKDIDVRLVKTATGPARSGYPAQQYFSDLIAAKAEQAVKRKTSTLAERCKLETLEGFIEHVTSKECRVEVKIRNFVPAYVTRLDTKTEILNSKFAVNAYHRKFELPQQPRTDEQSTARFDESWGVPSNAVVHGFAKVNKVWFMILKSARLPSNSSWPMAGGMYPTNLKPEAHQHRSKWTSFHALSVPEPAHDSSCEILVGSALVGFPTFPFILDGRDVTVKGT
mmetsp:Transcript_4640/g.8466  ORF Transcript_4640/g.8466 Transcript_4640/m.8466 type:complete len:680 (-) Transcript_4640:214-2253(-)